MNKIVGVLEKVKNLFTCGKKRRRDRDREESYFDEDIIFAIKKRRLSHSAQKKDRLYNNTQEINLFSNTNNISNDHKANLFFLSPYKLNLQTEILQGKNEEKKFFNMLTKRCREWNRKLNCNNTWDQFNICENVNFIKLEIKNTNIVEIDLLKDEAEDLEVEERDEENKSSILVEEIHIVEEKEWDAEIPKAPEIKFEFINLSVKNVTESKVQNEKKKEKEKEKEKEKSEPDSSDSSYSGCENVETKSEKEDDSKKLINEYESLVTSIKEADEDNKNIPIFDYDKFLKFRNFISDNYYQRFADKGVIELETEPELESPLINKTSFTKVLPGNYLNDEIINAYIDLILKRTKQANSLTSTYPNTFIFNTYFYEKYSSSKTNNEYSYEKMSKYWEKKNINLNDCECILVPINLYSSHWSLISVNIPERKFTYYDSLNYNENAGLKVMNSLSELFTEYIKRNKLKDEFLTSQMSGLKKKSVSNKGSTHYFSNLKHLNTCYDNNKVNTSSDSKPKAKSDNSSDKETDSENDLHMLSSFWKYKYAHTPKQSNGVDCGVFMCKFMDYLARDNPIEQLSQQNMDYYRFQIGIDIMEGKLMTN